MTLWNIVRVAYKKELLRCLLLASDSDVTRQAMAASNWFAREVLLTNEDFTPAHSNFDTSKGSLILTWPQGTIFDLMPSTWRIDDKHASGHSSSKLLRLQQRFLSYSVLLWIAVAARKTNEKKQKSGAIFVTTGVWYMTKWRRSRRWSCSLLLSKGVMTWYCNHKLPLK